MNENQGPQKNKRKTCAAEPSRAAERRKRFRAVCLLLCSFLWGVVLIRRLRTNCTRSDDPVLQHVSVKDDVNRSRFYVTFSPPARHMSTPCDAKTQRGIWDDSSCCDRAVLLVLLRILNPEDTILLDSSVLCESNLWWNNQTDSSDRSLWDYATWKQDEINHVGFILIDVVISVWFWIGSDSDSSFSLTNTLEIMIIWRLLESVANVSSHLSSFHPVWSHFSPFIQKIKASVILELVLVLILRFWLYFY